MPRNPPIVYLDEKKIQVIRDLLDRRKVVLLGNPLPNMRMPMPLSACEVKVILSLVEEGDTPECRELTRELREALVGR